VLTAVDSAAEAAVADAGQWAATMDGACPIDWRDQWYALAFLGDLQENQPNAFTVMEEPLVVWKEPSSGCWRVFRDSCPHRLVPLSEGRIDPKTGTLECPYHGWQFESSGKCTAIPEGGAMDHRCDALVYPSAIKQGILFVKPTPFRRLTSRVVVDQHDNLVDLDDLDTSGIPIVPLLEEGAGGVTLDVARDFPYDFALLMENLLDVGHVHFTHHSTISRRENAPVTTLTLDDRGKWGFTGKQGPEASGNRTSVFQAPGYLCHTIDREEEKGSVLLIVVYGVPVAPGRCRLLNRQVFKLKSKMAMSIIPKVPGWMFHPSNNTILEDDVIFLQRQMKEFVARGSGHKKVGQVYRVPYSSDAFVVAFHAWLERWGSFGPFGRMDEQWLKTIGPEQTQEQLLDRYQSHTKGCKSCSAALSTIERLRSWLLLGAAAAAATSVLATLALCLKTAAASAAAAGGHTAGASAPVWGASAASVPKWLAAIPAAALPQLAVAAVGAAALCGLVALFLHRQRPKYLQGSWPPPRNINP